MELLVVFAIFAILSAIAIPSYDQMLNKAVIASDEVVLLYKVVKSTAVSNTKAYRIEALDSDTVRVSSKNSCSSKDSWVEDPRFTLDLPTGASLQQDDFDGEKGVEWWNLCISSRGFPDSNIEFDINDNDGQSRSIEIFLGGNIVVKS